MLALSENLERPLMGQLGNFVAPGTATLLAFKVRCNHLDHSHPKVASTNTTEAAISFYTPKERQCYKV